MATTPLLPAHEAARTESPVRPRRWKRVASAIAAAALAIGIVAGAAAPANAYTYSAWGNARVDVPYAYAVAKAQLNTGNMWVFRNGAMPNQQQPITVRADLLIHTTAGWRVAGGMTKTVWVGFNDQAALVGSFTLVPGGYGYSATQTGYYSVRYTITWAAGIDGITGRAIGTSGQAVYVAQHNGDIKCSIARCTPSAGMVYLY